MEQKPNAKELGLEKIEDVITQENLMELFGVTKETIATWRLEKGLPYIKIGMKFFYTDYDLLEWMMKYRIKR